MEQQSGRDHTHHQQPEEGGDEEEVQENGKHRTQHLTTTSKYTYMYVYTVVRE